MSQQTVCAYVEVVKPHGSWEIRFLRGQKNTKTSIFGPPRRISCLVGFANAWKLSNTAYDIRIHQWKLIEGLWIDNRWVIAPGKYIMMFFWACRHDNRWSKCFFNTGKHSRNVYYTIIYCRKLFGGEQTIYDQVLVTRSLILMLKNTLSWS